MGISFSLLKTIGIGDGNVSFQLGADNSHLYIPSNLNGIPTLITTDINGNGQWNLVVSDFSQLTSAIADNSGNVYVTGRHMRPEWGGGFDSSKNGGAASVSGDGSLRWSYIDINQNMVYAKSIVSGSSIYLIGQTGIAATGCPAFITCLNKDTGVVQWSKTFSDVGYLTDIAVNNNRLYLSGGTYGIEDQDKLVVGCYDLSGNKIWFKNMGGDWSAGYALALTDKSVIVGGKNNTINERLVSLDIGNGTPQWDQTYQDKQGTIAGVKVVNNNLDVLVNQGTWDGERWHYNNTSIYQVDQNNGAILSTTDITVPGYLNLTRAVSSSSSPGAPNLFVGDLYVTDDSAYGNQIFIGKISDSSPSALLSEVNEGQTFTLAGTLSNLNLNTVYWRASGQNISSATFTGNQTSGPLSVSNNAFSLSLSIVNNQTTDGDRTLSVQFFSDANYTQSIGSTQIIIKDTSTATSLTADSSSVLPAQLFNLTLSGFGNSSGTGNASDNTIVGNGGNNVLSGLGGNDELIGGGGNDTLDGGAGFDCAEYKDAKSNLTINLGNGTNGFAQGGADVGRDTLISIEEACGGSGNDTITGRSDVASQLEGGAGNDTLNGGAFNDELIGGAGNDTLNGGNGFDCAEYKDAMKNLTINLGNGTNGSAYETGKSTGVGSEIGKDTLVSIEEACGGRGNDTITGRSDVASQLEGGAGNDTLNGGAFNDELIGGAGNDTLNGGNGFDCAEYKDATKDLTINLGNGTNGSAYQTGKSTGVGSEIGKDTLKSIEEACGGSGNDTITGRSDTNSQLEGGDGNDVLTGGSKNDNLIGGNGTDALVGGLGRDALTGGLGSDIFRYTAWGSSNADHITDFSSTQRDVIQISKSAFGITGNPTGTALFASMNAGGDPTKLGKSSALFVYDSSNGNLWFNKNQSAVGFGVSDALIATLDNYTANPIATNSNPIKLIA
mgnify:CR=1 FL=1